MTTEYLPLCILQIHREWLQENIKFALINLSSLQDSSLFSSRLETNITQLCINISFIWKIVWLRSKCGVYLVYFSVIEDKLFLPFSFSLKVWNSFSLTIKSWYLIKVWIYNFLKKINSDLSHIDQCQISIRIEGNVI